MKLAVYIIFLTVILASVIAAIIYRKELKQRRVGFLLPYLAYVFVQEATLSALNALKPEFPNAIVYNLYRVLTVIVFAVFFSRVKFLERWHRLIKITTIAFVLISILDHAFLEPITKNSSILGLVRGFILIVYGILFLFEYMQIESREEEKYWRPFLWITIGIVIFYPVISIALYLQAYLLAKSATLGPFKLYQLIPQVMSMFMYSCFIYAFHLCRKTQQT